MYTVQLRNLPKEIYEALKQSAADSRRSMTQQVIYFIERGLENQNRVSQIRQIKENALININQLHKDAPLEHLKQAMDWIKEDRDR